MHFKTIETTSASKTEHYRKIELQTAQQINLKLWWTFN